MKHRNSQSLLDSLFNIIWVLEIRLHKLEVPVMKSFEVVFCVGVIEYGFGSRIYGEQNEQALQVYSLMKPIISFSQVVHWVVYIHES